MSPADLAALFPYLKEIALFGGETLFEPGELPEAVYFPSNSAIALVAVMRDGRETKVTSVGYEGAIGLLPALIGIASSSRMVVQIGGGAIALPAKRLIDRAGESAGLMRLVLQFTNALVDQVERSAACHALHHLSARLARSLLICEDRVDRPQMELTQDMLGVMAGALRSSVSLAASEFKEQGLIRYSRGHLEIVDRAGLERRACECYAFSKTGRNDAIPTLEWLPAGAAAA